MGKMTLLYLSISLALMPSILVGGWVGGGGRVGRIGCGGRRGALLPPRLDPSDLYSLGSVSQPSFTVQVNMQQVWNLTHACK